MVAESAELLLDSLLAPSTRHPDDTVVEAVVEHRGLQSRIVSCPVSSPSLSSPWVTNRILVCTKALNMLLVRL